MTGYEASDFGPPFAKQDGQIQTETLGPKSAPLKVVSQNRYSTALHPFLEFGVHLGVYDVCLGPTTCSR
jgi:hypothetical protein